MVVGALIFVLGIDLIKEVRADNLPISVFPLIHVQAVWDTRHRVSRYGPSLARCSFCDLCSALEPST